MDDILQRARQLWSEIDVAVSPYPDGVVAVPAPVRRTAFFPGGLGVWLEDGEAPITVRNSPALIVGQDFNSVATYKRIYESGTEVGSSRTWRNLLPILGNARLPPNACVFTNFYMGLRESGPEAGTFPGARDRWFSDRCASFFLRQLDVWQPVLILTLGLPALRAVGAVCNVSTPTRMGDCACIYSNFSMRHGSVTLAALTHPSYYAANVGRRRYRNLIGSAAEQSMIADALTISNVSV